MQRVSIGEHRDKSTHTLPYYFCIFPMNQREKRLRCSSVIEHLLSMLNDPGLIPTTVPGLQSKEKTRSQARNDKGSGASGQRRSKYCDCNIRNTAAMGRDKTQRMPRDGNFLLMKNSINRD